MANAVQPAQQFTPEKAGVIMEAVIARGDLGQLSPEDRGRYYVRVCESVGLNPMTKPFEYLTLNGKLILYARKDATDQLRTIHGISVLELTETEREGVFVVTCKVQNRHGRIDCAKGAVTITGLKGDALANALMKAETKAKRRATLSICGLGWLDEGETETIPAQTKEMKRLPKKDARDIFEKLRKEVDASPSRAALSDWHEANAERIKVLPEDWEDILILRLQERMLDLQRGEPDCDADGVVWDEAGERPATAADFAQPKPANDGMDIPAAFDRRAKPNGEASYVDLIMAG